MRQLTVRIVFGLLILAASASSLAWADSQISHNLPSACETALFQFQTTKLPFDMGFQLEPSGTGQSTARLLTWYGVSNFDEILNPEIWSLDDGRYQFIDVGFRNLEADSKALNSAVLTHINKFPTQSMYVQYRIRRFLVESLLGNYRWGVHSAVIGKYLLEKPYLTSADLSIMTELNTISDNSDVFGVLKYDPEFPRLTNFSDQEIKKRLLWTIQVTYHGDRHYLLPSVKSLAAAAGIPADESADWLPFEYRIRADARAAFREKFDQRFDAKTTCEIIRYVNFDRLLPAPIRDGGLLRAFKTAKARGMKTILASGDSKTARLFRHYGFQVFESLPTDQTSEQEYLTYLEIDSPEYRKTVKRLARSASPIRREASGTD